MSWTSMYVGTVLTPCWSPLPGRDGLSPGGYERACGPDLETSKVGPESMLADAIEVSGDSDVAWPGGKHDEEDHSIDLDRGADRRLDADLGGTGRSEGPDRRLDHLAHELQPRRIQLRDVRRLGGRRRSGPHLRVGDRR